MLSDSLFEAHQSLKEDYLYYSKKPFDYSKDTVEEVEHILKRLDILRSKIDSETSIIEYEGSMKYEDGGSFKSWKTAVQNCNTEIIQLAGDLSEEEEPRDLFSSKTEHQKNLSKAFAKLKRERLEELKSVYKKYNDELNSNFKK